MNTERYNLSLSLTEEFLITQLVERALERGYDVRVSNSDIVSSSDLEEIIRECGACGDTTLSFYGSDYVGYVWLVHGNEEDVLTDYSANELTENLVSGLVG